MGTIRTAIIVGACIAPSAAFNIWPKLAAVVDGSAALDGETAAFLIFQTAAVVMMALCLPAMDRARGIVKKLAALSLAVILGLLNFTNALEVASHSRDSKGAANRGTIDSRAAVERQLADLQNSRKQLPQQTPVTAAAVDAAKTAASAATQAREIECKDGLGNMCRGRQDEEKAALAELAAIQSARAITARAEQLDEEIRAAREKLAQIGAAPKHEDGTAHRIGQIIGVEAETVMEYWPVFQAIAIEALALIGPYILLHEKAPVPQRAPMPARQQNRCRTSEERDDNDNVIIKPASAAVEKTAVRKTPATAAKSRKAKVSKGAAVTPAREWLENRTAARPGNDLRCNEVYADYVAFAEGRGETPMSMTAFGIAMRDELGIEKIQTPSKRSFYRGIALVSRPALVAIK